MTGIDATTIRRPGRPAARAAHRRPGPPTPWRPIDGLVAVLLGLGTLVARLATAASGPTDWDSAQFIAGSQRYDVRHGTPHPPGYFLYVESGRFVHAVTGISPTHSLVAISALASALASAALYGAARLFLPRPLAIVAVLVVATLPVTWFAGSIVDTYSFDELASAVLLLLARRAHPGSADGAMALLALGLIGGFRPSVLETLLLLALVAVAGSVRTWRGAATAAVAGVVGLGVWLFPLAVVQPGGLATWYRAAHAETLGAYHTSSIFLADHGGGLTNAGTFAAYATLTLAVPLLVALLGLTTGRGRRGAQAADAPRRWFQQAWALLVFAVVPPAAVYLAVEFGKGGYILALAPAATVLLLVPLAHRWTDHGALHRSVRGVAGVLLLATVAFNVQRFTAGAGTLPAAVGRHAPGLWLTQLRYGAPFPETDHTIEADDDADVVLRSLGAYVGPDDLLVLDTGDPQAPRFRDVGWALPSERIALVGGGAVDYEELHGSLYYEQGSMVRVGGGQRVVVIATSPSPMLQAMRRAGRAAPLAPAGPGSMLYRLAPGAGYDGVTFVTAGTTTPVGDIFHPGSG